MNIVIVKKQIIKAVSENEGKDIGLYYRDRLDFEAERDRKERSGEIETILIDRDKALEIAERAAGRKIDDLQIISTKDPNIKEIVGADAIAGRAYHVGNGKIVIVADNIGDYAKAMGTIAEEGRHIYHRKNNGLEDSEDYASFYGRQFERYYDRNFGNNDVAFITERLKYTKEQLGNDWENDAFVIGGKFSTTAWGVNPKINGSLILVRDLNGNMTLYFRGIASISGETAFAAIEAKLYVEYYPGVTEIHQIEKAKKKYDNGILNDGIKELLNYAGVAINSTSLYVKYQDSLLKNHRYTGIGFNGGYSFNFGSIENLLKKIKLKDNEIGTKISREIGRTFVKYFESKAIKSINATDYIQIGSSFRLPILSDKIGTATTRWWVKNTNEKK